MQLTYMRLHHSCLSLRNNSSRWFLQQATSFTTAKQNILVQHMIVLLKGYQPAAITTHLQWTDAVISAAYLLLYDQSSAQNNTYMLMESKQRKHYLLVHKKKKSAVGWNSFLCPCHHSFKVQDRPTQRRNFIRNAHTALHHMTSAAHLKTNNLNHNSTNECVNSFLTAGESVDLCKAVTENIITDVARWQRRPVS